LSPTEEKELREIVAELAYRRQVNPLQFFNHIEFQELFHNDPAKTKCLYGANRSGKSEEAAEYALTKGLSKPKQRIWMCSETFSDSVNILQRKVWGLVPKNRIAYGNYDDINGFTNRKLKLKNGTLIMFRSYDQGVHRSLKMTLI